MGLIKKSDGRYVVGKGIDDGNDYKGSAAWRDMVIQYSESGATDKSMEYLEYLRDYAIYHSGLGDPCVPPNVQIWMSTANTMKAVEADDITVDGETVTIGAVKWDGSAWTFGDPSTGGGGGGLPEYTGADIGKVLTLGEGSESETVVVVPEQTVTVTADSPAVLDGVDFSGMSGYDLELSVFINDEPYTFIGYIEEEGINFTLDVSASLSYVIATNPEIGTDTIYFAALNPKIGDMVPGTYTVSASTTKPSAVAPAWEPGLPAYTDADAGKVLTLAPTKSDEIEEVAVIPEQTVTVTLEDEYVTVTGDVAAMIEILTGQNTNPITITVNGDSADAVVSGGVFGASVSGIFAAFSVLMPEEECVFVSFTDDQMTGVAPGTYTVSLTVQQPVTIIAPSWQNVTRIPELPSLDGEYVLVITDGVASWESTK